MSTVLELEGVDSGYGEMQVLYDVSMELDEAEIVCLIGPNGAGKSTVLRTVFGMLEPWTGSVRYHDRDIGGMPPEDIVRLGIGYVPQTENVFSSLTVEENLRMGGVTRPRGGSITDKVVHRVPFLGDGMAGGDDLDSIIAELYDRFAFLREKRRTKARDLSGGQRQVLALARALVTEPDILLIDEPSAGLAPNTAEEVFDDIETVNEMGTALMLVEQNATEGLRIADRGYVLDQGSVQFVDEADQLLENDEVVQLYLGG